ncbi:MAG: hypothetical protein ACKVUT_18330 [Gaiella sp.]
MFSQALFDRVHRIASARWSVTAEETGSGGSILQGKFGDVSLAINTDVVNDMPIVRAIASVARRVPLAVEMLDELNGLNRRGCFTVLSIADDDSPGTVAVRASASIFGAAINESTIVTAVESCAWPANVLLLQGLLTRYGGEPGLAVLYRQMADSANMIGNAEMADSFNAMADELLERARAGTIGLLPSSA